MTWRRDTVQLVLASSREPYFRNMFFFFFPVFCASLCSLMRPGSCFYDEELPFSVFSLSLTFLATWLKYFYFSFCFPSMNYTAPREQLYFLHLAYMESEMVKTEWVLFFLIFLCKLLHTLTENTVCLRAALRHYQCFFSCRGVETQFVTAWLLNIMNKTVGVMTDVLIIVYHSGGYSWLCSAQKDC